MVTSPRQHIGVKARNVEGESWLEEFPVCEPLSQYQLLHVGLSGRPPIMRLVRSKKMATESATFLLACTSGCGRVFIDGRWKICRKGFACLLSANTLNTFEIARGKRWKYCWVCYVGTIDRRPTGDISSPVMVRFDPAPLRSAILGLAFECRGRRQPRLMQEWTDLVHAYFLRFARPSTQPVKLDQLWNRVASKLADDWTLSGLAREADYSKEHLRRLCHRHLGRSPMHQVTCLRMRYAADLLAATAQPIKFLARRVGYQSPFTFSKAFVKWSGWRPSEYRRKRINEAKTA